MQCAAYNKRGERCGNPAEDGYVTCDNFAHRAKDEALRGISAPPPSPAPLASATIPPRPTEGDSLADLLAGIPIAAPPQEEPAASAPPLPGMEEGGELDPAEFLGDLGEALMGDGEGAVRWTPDTTGQAVAVVLNLIFARTGAKELSAAEVRHTGQAWAPIFNRYASAVDPNSPWLGLGLWALAVLAPRYAPDPFGSRAITPPPPPETPAVQASPWDQLARAAA